MNILLVEDNPDDVKLIRVFLEEFGVKSLTQVDTLAQAVPLLKTEHFDIILLDLSLPDSRGLPTFDAIHTTANGVPIVIISGLDDENLATQAVRHGAQDYLTKGTFDQRWLWHAVRYAIQRSTWAQSTVVLTKVNDKVQALITAVAGVTDAITELNHAMSPR